MTSDRKHYKWSKSFLEAVKNGLTKAIIHDATTEEVRGLKQENSDLKKAVAELVLEVQQYNKNSACKRFLVTF